MPSNPLPEKLPSVRSVALVSRIVLSDVLPDRIHYPFDHAEWYISQLILS